MYALITFFLAIIFSAILSIIVCGGDFSGQEIKEALKASGLAFALWMMTAVMFAM